MKKLRKIASYSIASSILFLSPIPSNWASVSAQSNEGDYVIISNESTNSLSSQYTGSFDLSKINSNITIDENLNSDAYRMDVVLPIEPEENNSKLLNKSTNQITQAYKVGDIKEFVVHNFVNSEYEKKNAELFYSGTKANVWVINNEITKADAEKLAKEFDKNIYPVVVNNFGQESDINDDGKINILCFDIQDGFNGYGGYTAGYFSGNDLLNNSISNRSEIFYIDTYPTMKTYKTADADVSEAYSTLAHEFQHMVNFNQNYLIERGGQMDTWLNEALSMAAEQIYLQEVLKDRIYYYNYSSSIPNGHSLLYWDNNGDTLANYSLSYLFGQYIKVQASQGDSIFKEIIQDENNDYRAVESVIKKYVDSKLTFGQMMTNFRIALLQNESTGLYGFKGASGFNSIKPRPYTGGSGYLLGGGAVAKEINSDNFKVPTNKGKDVTYSFIRNGEVNNNVVDLNIINKLSDKDTVIKGTTEPGASVYIKKNSTVLKSGKADDNGNFNITIPKQVAGTILTVYSETSIGIKSKEVKITVIDKTAPVKPTVKSVADNATKVTGKAEAGSTVYVKAGTKQIGKGTSNSKGEFSASISKQKVGTVLTVYAVDKAGNKSTEVKVTVVDKTPPTKPTVNAVADNAKKVTGKAEAGSTIYVKAGSKQIGKATVNSKGVFTVSISKQKAGTSLTVYAVDKAKNKSAERKITVVDKTPPAAPTVNKVTSKTKKVTGKAEKNSTVYIYKGSKVIGKGTVSSKGTFSVSISAQKKGTVLKVYAYDKAKNRSVARTVKVN